MDRKIHVVLQVVLRDTAEKDDVKINVLYVKKCCIF